VARRPVATGIGVAEERVLASGRHEDDRRE